jgi:hypothetical protein
MTIPHRGPLLVQRVLDRQQPGLTSDRNRAKLSRLGRTPADLLHLIDQTVVSPIPGMTGGAAGIIAGAKGLYRPDPWSPPGAGQSSQMSAVSVIVADRCRVRSGLAVPVIVVILLSW